MISSEKTEFTKQLLGLASVKPGKELTKAGIDIWWNAMNHWSLEDFKTAAALLARTVEFMPSPFHFEQLRKAGRPTSGEGWARALQWARTGGHRGGPFVDDTLRPDAMTDRTVAAIGGYEAIAMSPSEKTHFLERAFAEHFESIQDAADTRAAVPQIATEGTNVTSISGARRIR